MRIDLSEATFIIPIRIESSDRLRNVITTTAFLLENFDTNIIIKEVDSESVFQRRLHTAPPRPAGGRRFRPLPAVPNVQQPGGPCRFRGR